MIRDFYFLFLNNFLLVICSIDILLFSLILMKLLWKCCEYNIIFIFVKLKIEKEPHHTCKARMTRLVYVSIICWITTSNCGAAVGSSKKESSLWWRTKYQEVDSQKTKECQEVKYSNDESQLSTLRFFFFFFLFPFFFNL